MRLFLRLSVVLGLSAVALAAQQKYPLRAVEIVGAANFDRDRIARLTGLEIGAPVDKNDFDNAIRKLDDAGVFETLEYRYAPDDGGYKLTITVKEVEQIYAVR